MEQRTQVRVECPQCHWQHFLEVEIDNSLLMSPMAKEIRTHLQDWIASRCPDHLGVIGEMSKN